MNRMQLTLHNTLATETWCEVTIKRGASMLLGISLQPDGTPDVMPAPGVTMDQCIAVLARIVELAAAGRVNVLPQDAG